MNGACIVLGGGGWAMASSQRRQAIAAMTPTAILQPCTITKARAAPGSLVRLPIAVLAMRSPMWGLDRAGTSADLFRDDATAFS
jgi:hypothetical protein